MEMAIHTMSTYPGDVQRRLPRKTVKAIRLVLGLAVLAAIVMLTRVDPHEFLQAFWGLHLGPLLALTALALIGRAVRAWKWRQLLRVQNVHISMWQAVRLSLVAHFAGSWTPGQVGGDAYRVLALQRFGRAGGVVSTLLVERFVGLSAVCFYAFLTLPVTLPYLYRQSPWLLALVVTAMLLVASVLPCLLSDRLLVGLGRCLRFPKESEFAGKLQRFHQTLLSYGKHPRTVLLVSLATLAEIFSYFVINYLAARALGLPVSIVFFLIAMPIVHLLLRIPISFQGLGIQEGCFVFAMVQHGFTPEQGLAVSVLQRALEWVFAIVPGGLLLWLTSGPSAEAAPVSTVNTDHEGISPAD
jgi:uncharacterized protein (TIRG00374 family)